MRERVPLFHDQSECTSDEWVSIFGLSVSGIEGDGQLTLAAALAGLAALAFGTDVIGRRRLPRPAYLAITGTGAALTAVIGLYDMNGFAAIGLYATMFAGIAWAAAVVWEIVESRRDS